MAQPIDDALEGERARLQPMPDGARKAVVIELVPAPRSRSVRRVGRGQFSVAVPAEPGPTLTARQVHRTRLLVRRGK